MSTKTIDGNVTDQAAPRDLYKKHHWQVLGPTFYQLHLLFDKPFGEQSVFVDSTNDLIVSDVIRTNEMQVWFLAEHVVETPLVRAE